jgi:anionic cell wall polymer biosynthesis LytR-Cps2A-Psr (LCP) family protein
MSIPRDLRVSIPGHGKEKINAAYAYGRTPLARATVENFLNITIHRTVVADWRGVKKCISLFKGLGLDYNGFSEKELFWHLRKRSFTRGDFRRIERQQRFLQYAGTEYLRLYNEVNRTKGAVAAVQQGALDLAVRQGLSVVETDLTYEEIQLLAYAFRDYNMRQLTMAQVSGRGVMEGGSRGEDTSGIYFFNPSPKHSFDEIIAKVEKQIQEDRNQ